MDAIPLWERPEAMINRELSWLAFNRRVLAEADNPETPLLERVKYLSITASNLDEFFMVRLAALRARALAGDFAPDPAGLSPEAQLSRALAVSRRFMEDQAALYHDRLLPALEAAGVVIRDAEIWDAKLDKWAERTFRKSIQPQLAPWVSDKRSPVPPLAGRAAYLAVHFEDAPRHALLQIPPQLPRALPCPAEAGGGYLLSDKLLARFAARMFPGRKISGCYALRVTRDADFTVEDESADLLAETEKSLKRRRSGPVVRLEMDARAPEAVERYWRRATGVREEEVFRLPPPLGLHFLLKELYGMPGMDAHRYPPFESRMPSRLASGDLFATLAARDVFLHHPYDSFGAVLRFVEAASRDPRVLAIKQTLYRVSEHSPIIRALCAAAEAGKQVTVLLEVKARFDEANNMRWGRVLERAGCVVLYGIPKLKTHSKITLVVRREAEGLRRYVHLGTGNYNDVTARQYTDMGVITCDEDLGEDATAFFNMITGLSLRPSMQTLVYAPRMLRETLRALIETEAENARKGLPSGIFAKMNSLVDPGIIRALYLANQAGVPIRLIVRGACCLRPGVSNLSEHIEVRSIVGRFLEHSRIFRFENGGEAKLFLSSADWMPRNLNRRIELMFPVRDPHARARVERVLALQWRDNVGAWEMGADGAYTPRRDGEPPFSSQERLFSPENYDTLTDA